MRISHCAAASVAAVVVFGAAAAQAQAKFDGGWRVEVTTEKGECNKTYNLPVVIESGRARFAGAAGTDALGSVSRDGVVTANISWGGTQAAIKGRLAGAAGRGTWSMTGTRDCSGRWVGQRSS